MTILERARPCAFSALLMCQAGSPVQAAVLAVFDFDAAGGGFTTTPGLLHPDVDTASFTTTLTPLSDFAGNPGRALASSGISRQPVGIQSGYRRHIQRQRLELQRGAGGQYAAGLSLRWRSRTDHRGPRAG